jgi:hypothetical protein
MHLFLFSHRISSASCSDARLIYHCRHELRRVRLKPYSAGSGRTKWWPHSCFNSQHKFGAHCQGRWECCRSPNGVVDGRWTSGWLVCAGISSKRSLNWVTQGRRRRQLKYSQTLPSWKYLVSISMNITGQHMGGSRWSTYVDDGDGSSLHRHVA